MGVKILYDPEADRLREALAAYDAALLPPTNHPQQLMDMASMPDFNPKTASRGDHSVTEGQVYWDLEGFNKVCCVQHRAMLCVSPDKRFWRCIACGAGAYIEEWIEPAV